MKLKFDFKKYFEELLFVPLGGTDEIGINLYLYHYKGKWLIVDMGLGFADSHYPGIDLLVPDITFLHEIRENIVGMVITHAHEDHLGAVQYLWSEVKVPIYTTKFTSAVLKAKLTDGGLANIVKIHEIKENSKFDIAPFSLEFVALTHSVPQMQGLVIRSEKGNLFHSGDWKFDPEPLIGNPSDLVKLQKLGDEGILAMICDSTNIFVEGRAGSEGSLQKSLNDLIAKFSNELVVITTFASNIARVYSIMKAAASAGRRVVLSGTSLWRMYTAARECGYLDDVEEPIHPKQFSKFKRKEIVVIATGCQGEQFATMNKLAKVEHPDIKLLKGDITIFASKIIPGNETKIFSLFNKFCKSGIEVLTEKDHFVHVSGHPCRDEIEEMYKYIRPKYAIPMHGEPMHTHEHAHFVKSKKLSTPLSVDNGSVVLISHDKTEVITRVHTGYMAIDGNFILPSDSEILKLRRRMRDHGAAIITIIYNKNGKPVSTEIIAPGILDSKEDNEYIEKLKSDISHYLKVANFKSLGDVENKVRAISKRFFKYETAKEPKIFVQLIPIA